MRLCCSSEFLSRRMLLFGTELCDLGPIRAFPANPSRDKRLFGDMSRLLPRIEALTVPADTPGLRVRILQPESRDSGPDFRRARSLIGPHPISLPLSHSLPQAKEGISYFAPFPSGESANTRTQGTI